MSASVVRPDLRYLLYGDVVTPTARHTCTPIETPIFCLPRGCGANFGSRRHSPIARIQRPM